MTKIYNNMRELIGNTPLLRVNNLVKQEEIEANILAKLESFNPGSSVKDRVAYAMIRDALDEKRIDEDTLLIEATSGNTGIGLASVGASLGFKVVIVMPETMSIERRRIVTALGAELVLTPGAEGMKGAIAKAKTIAEENPNSFIASQFDNQSNVKIHYETTGPEIYNDTDGKVDIFVSGIGTGGTITGVGTFLKEKNPNVKVIAVEPVDSPVLSGGKPGPHKIQGIGAGFVPSILNEEIYDEIIQVTTEDAFSGSRLIAKTEGILVGISSGAALHAAIQLAKRPENKGKNIVVLLPDTGERYLSTALFED